jgi:hypothetical protein
MRRIQIQAFKVDTKIFVRTHMATIRNNNIIYLPRPNKNIFSTIQHEEIHVKITKDWHDETEPIIGNTFSKKHTFIAIDKCQQYRNKK